MSELDFEHGQIDLFHGSGGRAMQQLIDQLFVPAFSNPYLDERNDQATFALPTGGARMVISTDSFVITPIFFPGGDIGSLAVHGTINDVAMSGARPLYLSCALILEEGFPLAMLKRVVASMATSARAAGVQVVTGDTKVVERGKADGIYINTTGVGVLEDPGIDLGMRRIAPGDRLLVSGFLGDHGAAVLSSRNLFNFDLGIPSDLASLHELVALMVREVPKIHALRDPTRGGVAAVCHEFAQGAGVSIELDESALPIREGVHALSEILGIDPLYLASEGKLVCVVPEREAERLLAVVRSHPLGRDAALIGRVLSDPLQQVSLITKLGSRRMVPYLMGEPLPRIC